MPTRPSNHLVRRPRLILDLAYSPPVPSPRSPPRAPPPSPVEPSPVNPVMSSPTATLCAPSTDDLKNTQEHPQRTRTTSTASSITIQASNHPIQQISRKASRQYAPHPFIKPIPLRSRAESIGLTNTEGRKRFPHFKRPLFEHSSTFGGVYQEVHPQFFESLEFKKYWEADPIILRAQDVIIFPKPEFRGARWRLNLEARALSTTIHRGSNIAVSQQDEPSIKYIATVCRRTGSDTSLIQLNAFLETQQLIHADNDDWPVLLLCIPNKYCDVPLADELKRYYETGLASLTIEATRRLVCRFARYIFKFPDNTIIDNTTGNTISIAQIV
ncbi:hypothetical protein GALMADRAFT_148503 [Galerina marginata CBS 339.88]|uniref:Uncharacterized protein n=1 Tax=Galerina marginata (strain CBS 339.88) TaxID=685588 RepID=A0A067S714_GALM3|nr:hypothetical protein GALMADRAFT_148503 [Galerina marginata CBS 339.88]